MKVRDERVEKAAVAAVQITPKYFLDIMIKLKTCCYKIFFLSC
jgi:hypothetical protein